MTKSLTWIFTEEEKALVSSLVSKGRIEQEKNDKFAIIDFESFYKLFTNDECEVMKKYLAIDPAQAGYKPPFLGIEEPPTDLVSLKNQKIVGEKETFIIPTQYLPKDTFETYSRLNRAMKDELGKEVLVLYGYRSPARQVFIFFDILQGIYDFDFQKTIQRVCFPAWSEHVCPRKQAIDFTTQQGGASVDFDQTEEYRWLQRNAQQFGFYESYPKDNDLDMMYEPWHWHHENA